MTAAYTKRNFDLFLLSLSRSFPDWFPSPAFPSSSIAAKKNSCFPWSKGNQDSSQKWSFPSFLALPFPFIQFSLQWTDSTLVCVISFPSLSGFAGKQTHTRETYAIHDRDPTPLCRKFFSQTLTFQKRSGDDGLTIGIAILLTCLQPNFQENMMNFASSSRKDADHHDSRKKQFEKHLKQSINSSSQRISFLIRVLMPTDVMREPCVTLYYDTRMEIKVRMKQVCGKEKKSVPFAYYNVLFLIPDDDDEVEDPWLFFPHQHPSPFNLLLINLMMMYLWSLSSWLSSVSSWSWWCS